MQNGHTTLVIYIDTSFDHSIPSNTFDGPTMKHTLIQLFDRLGGGRVRKCFPGGIKFVSAELSETIGHPDGPCIMFYRLFELLERERDTNRWSSLVLPGEENQALKERARRKAHPSQSASISADGTGFDHFMLMETDVFPIRPHWV